uniref:glycosyl hydrolase 115 family protein n=1 Tax=Chitinophaga sancti TaxID=1004 RepID=UPI003F7B03A8
MKNVVPLLILLCVGAYVHAQKIVTIQASQHSFPLPEVICIDQQDDWLVGKAAELLREDMRRVTGREVKVVYGFPGEGELRRKDGDSGGGLLASDTLNRKYSVSSQKAHPVILIGTLQSSLINVLHVDTTGLTGKWEAFRITVAAGRVTIIGSDKRGAAYGALELSRQLGVSPWYWWADVPVIKKKKVFIQEGRYDFGPPSVQYRGIFINDEAPAFSGWTHEKFGGFNHLVYEKVFELLLRLRGNYLWPAMWGNAFNTDDTLNPVLADKWGIVMGTSHHEPMLRAQQEWKKYGRGAWDYVSNDSILRAFWRKGIVNMGGHESIVTVGMRGDGDMPMSNETATGLLERIVKDQREIISGVTGKPASETPQMWALYKEVQDYYDKGMRVPDDVTLLLCDDNWGNIRRLPVRAVGVVVGKGSGVVADE